MLRDLIARLDRDGTLAGVIFMLVCLCGGVMIGLYAIVHLIVTGESP